MLENWNRKGSLRGYTEIKAKEAAPPLVLPGTKGRIDATRNLEKETCRSEVHTFWTWCYAANYGISGAQWRGLRDLKLENSQEGM